MKEKILYGIIVLLVILNLSVLWDNHKLKGITLTFYNSQVVELKEIRTDLGHIIKHLIFKESTKDTIYVYKPILLEPNEYFVGKGIHKTYYISKIDSIICN